METAFNHALGEMPLALFSTLASLGAGTFIALTIAFLCGASHKLVAQKSSATQDGADLAKDAKGNSDAKDGKDIKDAATNAANALALRKTDFFTLIPLLLVALGFVAAFFHLATPGNAFNAFNGIGRSPMSNEILAGIIFVAVAVIYWIAVLTGKIPDIIRKILLALACVAAVAFIVLIGAAYMVSTIPTWDTPLPIIALLGFGLLGGTLFCLLVLQSADNLQKICSAAFKRDIIGLGVLGAIFALVGVIGQFVFAGSLVSSDASVLASGAMSAMAAEGIVTATAEMMPWVIAFAIGIVLSLLLAVVSVIRKPNQLLISLGCLVVLASVLAGRLVFYALYVNVGL
ncbi:MAG: dimethyl sulfoxide reductase anchor subunit [Coriobacteriales bacterium]|jgi:anaerobic dimethyl sulfoxide reductase subunit C (anchor subunit)/Tat-targeted selenate reductase subunit YnfH|nr:dimethyl sulfoxide reductase anchor subunit [Coriobacteriales bacterium]